MIKNFLDTCEVVVSLYVLIHDKETDKFRMKKVNISTDSKDELKTKIIENLKILKNYSIMPLEDYDNRNEIFYKINDFQKSEKLENLLEEVEKDITEEYSGDFTDVYGLLFEVKKEEDVLWIYRQNYSVNVISDKNLSMVLDAIGTFKFLNQSIFKLSVQTDFYIYKNKTTNKNEIFINNLKVVERNFGLKEIIKKKALENINEIEKLDLIQNIEVLKEKVERDDMTFNRKLMKLKKESPVFKLEKKRVMNFVKSKKLLKIIIDDTVEKISVSTEKEKELFLRLLNDDILHSELTDMEYIANSKDKNEFVGLE